jgi:hypothetical protein
MITWSKKLNSINGNMMLNFHTKNLNNGINKITNAKIASCKRLNYIVYKTKKYIAKVATMMSIKVIKK